MGRSPILGVLCSLWLVGLTLLAGLHPLTHLEELAQTHVPEPLHASPCLECLALAPDAHPALPLPMLLRAQATGFFHPSVWISLWIVGVGAYRARAPPLGLWLSAIPENLPKGYDNAQINRVEYGAAGRLGSRR